MRMLVSVDGPLTASLVPPMSFASHSSRSGCSAFRNLEAIVKK